MPGSDQFSLLFIQFLEVLKNVEKCKMKFHQIYFYLVFCYDITVSIDCFVTSVEFPQMQGLVLVANIYSPRSDQFDTV